jgi:hypothetical protein
MLFLLISQAEEENRRKHGIELIEDEARERT